MAHTTTIAGRGRKASPDKKICVLGPALLLVVRCRSHLVGRDRRRIAGVLFSSSFQPWSAACSRLASGWRLIIGWRGPPPALAGSSGPSCSMLRPARSRCVAFAAGLLVIAGGRYAPSSRRPRKNAAAIVDSGFRVGGLPLLLCARPLRYCGSWSASGGDHPLLAAIEMARRGWGRQLHDVKRTGSYLEAGLIEHRHKGGDRPALRPRTHSLAGKVTDSHTDEVRPHRLNATTLTEMGRGDFRDGLPRNADAEANSEYVKPLATFSFIGALQPSPGGAARDDHAGLDLSGYARLMPAREGVPAGSTIIFDVDLARLLELQRGFDFLTLSGGCFSPSASHRRSGGDSTVSPGLISSPPSTPWRGPSGSCCGPQNKAAADVAPPTRQSGRGAFIGDAHVGARNLGP